MNKDDYINQFEDDLTPEMILALDLLQEDNWISVEDELPKENEKVLVWIVGMPAHFDSVFTAVNDVGYNNDEKEYIWRGAIERIGGRITHWQPLPKPPQE